MAERPTGLGAYYLLIATQAVSQLGSRVSVFAVGIAVFLRTSHATPIAIISFCQTLPWIVGAGLGGALADRFDRRSLMIAANLGFTAASGVLLASFLSGAFQLWLYYVLSFVTSAIGTVSAPAFRASVAMLVPDSHRDRANAIGQMTGPAANAIAPFLAGLLYAVIGVAGAIVIDICTFLVAIAALAVVHIPMPAKTAEGRAMAGGVWRQAFDGFRYLAARPNLLGLGLVVSTPSFLMAALGVLVLPYALARTHSTLGFGVILASAEAGFICGAAVIGAWGGTRPRIHATLLGLAAAGVMLTLIGHAQTTLAIAASFYTFMFALPFVNTSSTSIFQAKIAPDVQGRVFGALSQIAVLTAPIAFFIAGPVCDQLAVPAVRTASWRAVAWLVGSRSGSGMGLILAIGGGVTTAIALIAYAFPGLRNLEATLPSWESAT